MNFNKTLTTFSLLSLLTFGASAATQINDQQAATMTSIGTISASEIAGNPLDMNQQLNQEATDRGATAYRIIEARQDSTWHYTAELYK